MCKDVPGTSRGEKVNNPSKPYFLTWLVLEMTTIILKAATQPPRPINYIKYMFDWGGGGGGGGEEEGTLVENAYLFELWGYPGK